MNCFSTLSRICVATRRPVIPQIHAGSGFYTFCWKLGATHTSTGPQPASWPATMTTGLMRTQASLAYKVPYPQDILKVWPPI